MRMPWSTPRSASIRSSRTCAITLRAVLAWQTMRTVATGTTASALLSRPLPEPHAAAQVRPLARRPLVQRAAELHRRRHLQIRAERLGEHVDELVGSEPPASVDAAQRMRLGQERVAVAEGVEGLAVDTRCGVAGQVHDERGHVVGIALRPLGLLARPLSRLLEHGPPARRRID